MSFLAVFVFTHTSPFDLFLSLVRSEMSIRVSSGFVRREMVDNGYMGYGSAASTALFLIIGLCTVAYIRIGRMKLGED